jgi:oxygen-independent coproporphyrinogen-3 oxidase
MEIMMSSIPAINDNSMFKSYDQRISIYIHFPFCQKRCSYCDFVTYAGKSDLIPGYIKAIKKEITEVAQGIVPGTQIHTIYFGGGTPSLLPEESIKEFLGLIFTKFPVTPDVEITMEINPGTVIPGYMEKLFQNRINRLSIGMQSANDSDLKSLGRIHNFAQFSETIKDIKDAGFGNFSFDLIYGIPGQSLESWRQSLERAVNLNPPHLSIYSLTIEENTPFWRLLEEGKISKPDDDQTADMYELTSEFLRKHGYHQYEISNWARKKEGGKLYSSIHNLQYWRNLPYLGFGPGSHGSAAGVRSANTSSIEDYIQRSGKNEDHNFPLSFASETWQSLSKKEKMEETMMLGLRLTGEGVSEIEFRERFGKSPTEVFGQQIDQLVSQGLLERIQDDRKTIRITSRGRLLGNRVFMEFVGG